MTRPPQMPRSIQEARPDLLAAAEKALVAAVCALDPNGGQERDPDHLRDVCLALTLAHLSAADRLRIAGAVSQKEQEVAG